MSIVGLLLLQNCFSVQSLRENGATAYLKQAASSQDQPLPPKVCWEAAVVLASQVALVVKNLPTNAGDTRDTDLIPGLVRSPGIANGSLLQYFCQESRTEEPVRLQSMGSQGVRHDWAQAHKQWYHIYHQRFPTSLVPHVQINVEDSGDLGLECITMAHTSENLYFL